MDTKLRREFVIGDHPRSLRIVTPRRHLRTAAYKQLRRARISPHLSRRTSVAIVPTTAGYAAAISCSTPVRKQFVRFGPQLFATHERHDWHPRGRVASSDRQFARKMALRTLS
jgi:hypothetical protein